MKKIKYIGYYALPERHRSRGFVLAATNKMTYICEALNEVGYEVEIVSASGSSQKERAAYCSVNPHTTLKLFRSFGQGPKLQRVLKRWILLTSFFCYLLFHLKKGEPVLVYHSLGYMSLVAWLKKLTGCKLILEVEEIYSDVIGNPKTREKELAFFGLADAYLFPTELLDEAVNSSRKPSVIIYGTYRIEHERESGMLSADGLPLQRNLLYAGTFDPRKGGAAAAAAAAKFLPEGYHIHILGFGSDNDKQALQHEIERRKNSGGATVTMDGLLHGEDYIRFVQSCDVGFSTQMPDAAFNNTSFPSKILSYLANGLRVVSVRIPALERSAISDLLYYYDGDDPKKIADAVMKIDWNKPYDSRAVIRELDKKFVKEFETLLREK